MIINEVTVIRSGKKARVQSVIDFDSGRKETLWYEMYAAYADHLTDRLDGFLVAMLSEAMLSGEDIIVKGTVSTKLYYNLTHHYMKILTLVIPRLRIVKINAQKLDPSVLHTNDNVITGFSAGIDSFCVLADHLYGDVPEQYKLTHFLFNDVGSHRGSKELFNKRYDRLKKDAETIGLPLLRVESNLNDILTLDFPQTHTLRNISVVLLLQGLFSKYLYASGMQYSDCNIHKSSDIAYSDAAAVHLLSTETLECISSGGQYARTEKTMKVSSIPASYNILDVCIKEPVALTVHNCSTCWKCMRTMLTLEIIGKLDLYKSVFNLKQYRKYKFFYCVAVQAKGNTFACEIVNLTKSNHYHFPLASGILALFYPSKLVAFAVLARRRLRELKKNRDKAIS